MLVNKFKAYSEFLVFLLMPKNQHLVENAFLVENHIPLKECFLKEPLLFEAFCAQCNREMSLTDKATFSSYVNAYFSLKSAGYFKQPDTSEILHTVVARNEPVDVYVSAFSENSAKKLLK